MNELTHPLIVEAISPELVFLLSDYVVIAISLGIAYIAYQGFRSHDSRPMLYIAAGFSLAFGGPGSIFLLSLVLPIPTLVVGTITQSTELLGMGLILYGFIAPARATMTQSADRED
jgi:hypothetical protein